jgi:MYXO-CTERM domain-containing protein
MRRSILALGVSALLLAPATASAHFYIDYPDAAYYPGPSPAPWWNEDALGLPQKLGPCGDEDDATDAGGGPTGVVTPFVAGQTVTLQWTEVISHTGWFRIAIAADRSEFVDPPIVVDSNGNSADAGVENPPVSPVVADGVYPHQIGSSKTWPPYTITLPNMTCTKCTIQIIQIMLDHPSNLGDLPDGAANPDGFLYHHCIDISISSPGGDGGESTSASTSVSSSSTESGSSSSSGTVSGTSTRSGSESASSAGTNDAGTGEKPAAKSSCGCSFAGAPAAAGSGLSLFVLAGLLRRRRRGR